MTKFILIRGYENSGKTATAGLVYSDLIKIAQKEHVFNYIQVNDNGLMLNDSKDSFIDFTAILTIRTKQVGIISAGDIPLELEKQINMFLSKSVDIIICCTRSRNVVGSSYRMIQDKFLPTCEIVKEFWVSYTPMKKDVFTVKEASVMEIVNHIISLTK